MSSSVTHYKILYNAMFSCPMFAVLSNKHGDYFSQILIFVVGKVPDVSALSRFGPGSFRPWLFRPWFFRPGRFGPGSFRPNLVGRFGLIFSKSSWVR